tara:strand:- start:7 stop:153 length:147 start_codon:yes stop_codon:yes gene_type:complete
VTPESPLSVTIAPLAIDIPDDAATEADVWDAEKEVDEIEMIADVPCLT